MNINETDHEALLHKLYSEPVFILYDFEDCVIRSEPGKEGPDFWVKFKGEKEFKARPESKLVWDAVMYPVLITQEEYEKY